jgi:hypothetical protein
MYFVFAVVVISCGHIKGSRADGVPAYVDGVALLHMKDGTTVVCSPGYILKDQPIPSGHDPMQCLVVPPTHEWDPKYVNISTGELLPDPRNHE